MCCAQHVQQTVKFCSLSMPVCTGLAAAKLPAAVIPATASAGTVAHALTGVHTLLLGHSSFCASNPLNSRRLPYAAVCPTGVTTSTTQMLSSL